MSSQTEGSIVNDEERLKYVERTKNGKGYMFLKIGESAEYWVNSLPSSSLPLLDLGSAYGVHTLHAMKAGRDVIALDLCAEHIETLKERARALVSKSSAVSTPSLGRLVDGVVGCLPNLALFPEESFSGVLLSEVMHFFKPGEPLQMMQDMYKWVAPGGLVIVTSTSGEDLEAAAKLRFLFTKGRSVEQVRAILDGPDEVLIEESPTFTEVPEGLARKSVGDHMYLITTRELGALAKHVGFEIVRLTALATGKYPVRPRDKDEKEDMVLLVARKPDNSLKA